MIRLEDLEPNTVIVLEGQEVKLLNVSWPDSDAVQIFFERNDDASLDKRLLYRENEIGLELPKDKPKWAFDADGKLFSLVSEAYRIRLAHLVDPMSALNTSLIEPLPHQITAVYEHMLPRQPIRFLLADEPGAGKTIMAGMLIRELIARGDVRRCLICLPGKLDEQWRVELERKFQLDFEIITRPKMSGRRPFDKLDRLIVSVDFAKQDDIKAELEQSRWDLVICDEAHQMSARCIGKRPIKTDRYDLGEVLSRTARHFVLMTATPHNGKDPDWQFFVRLLDRDRFAEPCGTGESQVEASDLYRRMLKEDLRNFDQTPLLPERKAHFAPYDLSDDELELYRNVTNYVREEFSRAERLTSVRHQNSVGFVMTILQRRLASSPEAIYQSLKRRRTGLEEQLKDAEKTQEIPEDPNPDVGDNPEDNDNWNALERQQQELKFIGKATTADNISELRNEIETLTYLEEMALQVRNSRRDRKWEELRNVFTAPEMKNEAGQQRKLIIFSEYKDTLKYLRTRLEELFEHPDAIDVIDGDVQQDVRRTIEKRFHNDSRFLILLANDAAGEGINLQCTNLMVNYDLPWNPSRLAQRFGRIHRIGQKEVCHLWNLVAPQTREGDVYDQLMGKINTISEALNVNEFDILGNPSYGRSLRDLIVDEIKYSDDPERQREMQQKKDNIFKQEHVSKLFQEEALETEIFDTSKMKMIHQKMGRAAVGRLQPFHVKAFFTRVLGFFKGELEESRRERGRHAINRVPMEIRAHASENGLGIIKGSYKGIYFDKVNIDVAQRSDAELVCTGHPLLETTIDLLLRQKQEILKDGAILLDTSNIYSEPRIMFYLETIIRDSVPDASGGNRTIMRNIHFVESGGEDIRGTGAAPYLDYRPATGEDITLIETTVEQFRKRSESIEKQVIAYTISHLIPPLLNQVKCNRNNHIDKENAAIEQQLPYQREQIAQCQQNLERQSPKITELESELDDAEQLREWFEEFSELTPNQSSERLEQSSQHEFLEQIEKYNRIEHSDPELIRESLEKQLDLQKQVQRDLELAQQHVASLKQRLETLKLARLIHAAQPNVIGAALIIPGEMFRNERTITLSNNRRVIEEIAMSAIMNAEESLGYQPKDVSKQNLGYDIESVNKNGALRFIEVKGRTADAPTVTLTRNELITALNCSENYILALVLVENEKPRRPCYIESYPFKEPDPSAHSVTFKIKELLKFAGELN